VKDLPTSGDQVNVAVDGEHINLQCIDASGARATVSLDFGDAEWLIDTLLAAVRTAEANTPAPVYELYAPASGPARRRRVA
jgi:hypothetical protein